MVFEKHERTITLECVCKCTCTFMITKHVSTIGLSTVHDARSHYTYTFLCIVSLQGLLQVS